MKKFILSFIFGIVVLSTTTSCITEAYAQDVVVSDENGNANISLVIRYGTPYYFEGSILYYIYNGWYYYPYLHNNYYYYYRYSHPLPPPRHGHRFMPGYNDRPYYRFHRNHHPRPHGNVSGGHHHPRPNGNVGGHHHPRPHGNVGSGQHHPRPHGSVSGSSTRMRPNMGRPSTGGVRQSPRGTFRGGNRPHGGGGHFGGRH